MSFLFRTIQIELFFRFFIASDIHICTAFFSFTHLFIFAFKVFKERFCQCEILNYAARREIKRKMSIV